MTSAIEQRTKEILFKILLGHRLTGHDENNPIEKICECGQRFVGLLAQDEHQRIEQEKIVAALLTDIRLEAQVEQAKTVERMIDDGFDLSELGRYLDKRIASLQAERRKAGGTQ